MEWINLKVSTIRQPEYVGSDPTQRATWFNVLAYCIEQENNGRIVGAAAWKDRQWQQTCGVLAKEVKDAPLLLTVDGGDIVVWNYPTEKQEEVQARREAGRKGGLRSGQARTKQKRSSASTSASTEGNGKEGNGRRREEEQERTAREREVDSLPDVLKVEPFLSTWPEWIDYSIAKNNGRSVPMQTFDAHLRTCLDLGPAAGAAALRLAIERNLRAPVAAAKILSSGGGDPAFDPSRPNAHTGGAEEAK